MPLKPQKFLSKIHAIYICRPPQGLLYISLILLIPLIFLRFILVHLPNVVAEGLESFLGFGVGWVRWGDKG